MSAVLFNLICPPMGNSSTSLDSVRRLLTGFVAAVVVLLCLEVTAHAQVTYAYTERSNPSGLITAFSEQVPSGNQKQVRNFSVVSGTYRFGFWTINGVRQAYPNGQAFLNPVVTVNGPTDAVANFFPVAEDGDGDRLPDWWEYWMFGDRSRGPQDDDDADGVLNEKEYVYGYSARFRDDIASGGVASRLSAPLRMIVRNRLRYTLRSEPLGLVSAEGELAPGTSYTTPYLLGDTNGYTFVGFEVNGQVSRDVTGYYLNQITITPSADTEIVARYVTAGSDTDSDGIPDAVEWQNFGTLANGPSSDPDGDGFSIADERRRGLSLITKERLMDGGIASRLSAPLSYDRIRSLYTVQSRPFGLITSTSELVQNGTERVSPQIGTALVSGYAFGYWSLNGQRIAGPDGLARRQAKVTVNGLSELTAHFFLPDQDTDADGLPDWWEWNSFGSLGYGPQNDPDSDGLTIADERRLGLAVATKDVLRDGGIASRLSAPLQYESGSRKRFAVRSQPRGIVADTQSYIAANSSVSTSQYTFNQLYSGYHFTHWTRNGQRVSDSSGHSRNQVSFSLQEDTEMVANFVLPGEDLDGDTIPDYQEFRLAGNLSTLSPSSDPDGDGVTLAAELRMGFAPLSRDLIRDGGIGTRLSAPAELKFIEPPLTLKPDRLKVVRDSPAGFLVGTLSLSPPLPGRTYQFALELGTGGDDNSRFLISGGQLRLASTMNATERVLRIRIRATDDLGVVRIFQPFVYLGTAQELADPASLATWLGQQPNLSNPAPDADPDGDGNSNLLEYVLGGDPSRPDPNIAPRVTGGNGNLTLTFQRPDAAETADVSLSVETSTDLVTWQQSYVITPGPPASQVSIQENGTNPDTITVTIPATANQRFTRLKASLNP